MGINVTVMGGSVSFVKNCHTVEINIDVSPLLLFLRCIIFCSPS
jgi:hypothetical protein